MSHELNNNDAQDQGKLAEKNIVDAKNLIDSLIKFYNFEDQNTYVPAISIKDHLENLKELLADIK